MQKKFCFYREKRCTLPNLIITIIFIVKNKRVKLVINYIEYPLMSILIFGNRLTFLLIAVFSTDFYLFFIKKKIKLINKRVVCLRTSYHHITYLCSNFIHYIFFSFFLFIYKLINFYRQ